MLHQKERVEVNEDVHILEQLYQKRNSKADKVNLAIKVLETKMEHESKNVPETKEWLLELNQLSSLIHEEMTYSIALMQAIYNAFQNEINNQQRQVTSQSEQCKNTGLLNSLEHSDVGQMIRSTSALVPILMSNSYFKGDMA